VRIIEADAIKTLINAGFVVVAVGGGGIPVVRDDQGNLSGAAAVIDKDLASAVVAKEIGANLLVISTAVEKVCLNFGKPDQKSLDRMTVAEARQYMKDGHFKPGSMLPKVQACIQFLEQGGNEALITCPESLSAALEGKTGTHVVR
jgi:carbamate kinase